MDGMKVPATLDSLEKLMQLVSGFAGDHGFLETRISEIQLATEEALLNIFQYAYPGEHKGEVEVTCEMTSDSELNIQILDAGTPFDILSLSEPDLACPLPDRKIGGLGCYLIRKMSDDVHYHRQGNANILTLLFRKGSSKI
jgi:sigma-B regulation protein RsbU (phosphoserine phosphatase)